VIERVWYRAPDGWGSVRYEGNTVLAIDLPRRRSAPPAAKTPPKQIAALLDALQKYFDGERRTVDLPGGLTFDWESVGDFRRKVYQEVSRIPAGGTMSYGEVARRVGHPGAARAVGTAMATNPFAPIVPCHRVVRSDGSLGGYGGGLPLKERMLANERGEQRLPTR
jgi:methylated-DNA-[protein]-cysteine S-methyltransferase